MWKVILRNIFCILASLQYGFRRRIKRLCRWKDYSEKNKKSMYFLLFKCIYILILYLMFNCTFYNVLILIKKNYYRRDGHFLTPYRIMLKTWMNESLLRHINLIEAQFFEKRFFFFRKMYFCTIFENFLFLFRKVQI